MKNKLSLAPGIVLPVLLAFACKSIGIPMGSLPGEWPERETLARVMPAVSIQTSERTYMPVKIVRLWGKELTVLPYPYWNSGSLKIDAEQIASIRLVDERKAVLTVATTLFAAGFCLTGMRHAIQAEHNKDYGGGLVLALISGTLFGLAGLIVGALSESSRSRRWDMTGMSTQGRLRILLAIMGVRP